MDKLPARDPRAIARLISLAENNPEAFGQIQQNIHKAAATKVIPVLGITGTGVAGKSSLVDELVRRYLIEFRDKSVAINSGRPWNQLIAG